MGGYFRSVKASREGARKMRTAQVIEGLVNGDKKVYAKVEITLPPSFNVQLSNDEQLDCCWLMWKNLKLIMKRGYIDKRGRKQTYPFENAIFWEFGKKSGRIHAHVLIDKAIPWKYFQFVCVKVGFGKVIHMEKIDYMCEAEYRNKVEYAAKYCAKGGWNVTQGRKRFDMSREYRKSVQDYLKLVKKPFDGVVTDGFGRAVINEVSVIEDLSSPEKFFMKGDLGRAGVASGEFDPGGIARGRMIVERKGAASMDIRPVGRHVSADWFVQPEPVKAEKPSHADPVGHGSAEYFRELDERLKPSS